MSQVQDLAEENESLKKQLAEFQENLKGYEKDYDEIVNENDSLRAKLQAFKAEEEKEEESYEDEEAEKEEKVGEEKEVEEAEEEEEQAEEDKEAEEEKKALETEEAQARALTKALRNLGAEPVHTKPQARVLSRDEVLEKFASINDPKERATFYAINRKVIFN